MFFLRVIPCDSFGHVSLSELSLSEAASFMKQICRFLPVERGRGEMMINGTTSDAGVNRHRAREIWMINTNRSVVVTGGWACEPASMQSDSWSSRPPRPLPGDDESLRDHFFSAKKKVHQSACSSRFINRSRAAGEEEELLRIYHRLGCLHVGNCWDNFRRLCNARTSRRCYRARRATSRMVSVTLVTTNRWHSPPFASKLEAAWTDSRCNKRRLASDWRASSSHSAASWSRYESSATHRSDDTSQCSLSCRTFYDTKQKIKSNQASIEWRRDEKKFNFRMHSDRNPKWTEEFFTNRQIFMSSKGRSWCETSVWVMFLAKQHEPAGGLIVKTVQS